MLCTLACPLCKSHAMRVVNTRVLPLPAPAKTRADCGGQVTAEINADIDRLVTLKLEIMNTIWQVEDAKACAILERRYHSFKSWEEIAADLNVSVRWVHKIHGKALEDVEKILKKDIKMH